MLQTRHRADKENQVHRPPKTPGPGKSIISHKTPFHDENHTQHVRTAVKKSVAFGGSANEDTSKVDMFQTPAPRRILGGKDLNSRHTPFQPLPSTAKQFKNAQGGDAWSPPFSRPTHRRQSRRSSIGIRSSPVEAVVATDFDEEIEYMPPTPAEIPYEPANYEPIDWEIFGAMRQDIASYFIKTDEFGKSDMDYFVETTMDFGADEELPIAPVPQSKTKKSVKGAAAPRKSWVPTKRITSANGKSIISGNARRISMAPTKAKTEKFMREDMRDEVAALRKEELALCKEDDFGMSFDLEL